MAIKMCFVDAKRDSVTLTTYATKKFIGIHIYDEEKDTEVGIKLSRKDMKKLLEQLNSEIESMDMKNLPF